MIAAIEEMGVTVTPSQGNFVLAHFKDAEQSQAVDSFLRSKGIIVRPVGNYDLAHALRITIGTDEENEALLSAMGTYFA